MRAIPTPSWLRLLTTAAVFLAAVSLSSGVHYHAGVLHLERMNSSSVAMEELRARDRSRHAGLLNGVVSFPVYGSADANVFGVSTSRFGGLVYTDYAVDGILGFGPGKLSIFSQLSWRGLIPRVFCHCLKGEGGGGGIFVLGEIVEPGMIYTRLVPTRFHYSLYLRSISVNQRMIPVDLVAFKPSTSRGTLVDTGTTFSYIVEEAYGPFLSAVKSVVSLSLKPEITRGRGHCYHVISFEFTGGASLVLRPEEYLVHDNDGRGAWCIGFLSARGLTILGDLVLKDKIFVYDLVRQQIGWTSYNCSTTANVSIPARPSSSSTWSRGMILQLLPLAMAAALFLHASSLLRI